MRSLFLKIFVWFWVVQLLIGVVMFSVTTAMRFQPDAERPETAFALEILARDAMASYERGGARTLRDNMDKAERETRSRTFFFDAQGHEISGAQNAPRHQKPNRAPNFNAPPNSSFEPPPKPPLDEPFAEALPPRDFEPRDFPHFLPPPVRDAAQQFARRNAQNATQTTAPIASWHNGPISAREVRSTRGAPFLLVALVPRLAPRPFSPGFISDLIRPSGSSALRLLVLVLTSGALCFGLARYLTSPTVKLRRATQQFSSGDLTTRVGAQMGKRRDELADLGRDFDQMAERIETLMLAERRLLADISHELRSPLARLTVALDLIETIEADAKNATSSTRSSTEAQKERAETGHYLQRIRRESERLNAMIGQVLALSRLESGDSRGEKTPIDLEELLQDIAQDADFEARGRNRRVEIARSEPLSTRGVPELLRSAIENVVRNAVHYTKENSMVEISLTRDGDCALVRVLDCGHGVPESALQNLFRPFYRVADARDRQSGGTGLGLAITERAVRLHGGQVAARNAEKGGLLVELRLPLQKI